MHTEMELALATGAFWGAIYFIYGWRHPSKGQSKLSSAAKAAAVAFLVMALFTRACTAILPESRDGPPDCERYPGIYGC